MTDESDPGGNPFEHHCPECDEITVHNSHYRCIECFQYNEDMAPGEP